MIIAVSTVQDIVVTTDQVGRPVVIVGESDFMTLRSASRRGWVETPGVGYGESARLESTDPAALILDRVCAAIIESPLSTDEDRALARTGASYAMITSPTRWDAERRWWATAAPHTVGGSFSRTYSSTDRRYQFAG